ncbi:hypothetical protein VTI74DRAFT_846 [Chaetomium olivicolor]
MPVGARGIVVTPGACSGGPSPTRTDEIPDTQSFRVPVAGRVVERAFARSDHLLKEVPEGAQEIWRGNVVENRQVLCKQLTTIQGKFLATGLAMAIYKSRWGSLFLMLVLTRLVGTTELRPLSCSVQVGKTAEGMTDARQIQAPQLVDVSTEGAAAAAAEHDRPVRVLVQTKTHLVPGDKSTEFGERVSAMENMICQHVWQRDYDRHRERAWHYGCKFALENIECWFLVDHHGPDPSPSPDPPVLWYILNWCAAP